jgi:hypothetical protein
VLWRSGLRIAEALDLRESDLDERRGALLVRHGKGGKRREVGMDDWGWEQLRPWIGERQQMPIGRLFCVIEGPTSGRPWAPGAVRTHLRRIGVEPGVRRRFAPHQLRHAHAVEMAREGVPLNVIQRQLGHTDLGVTSVYLQGIDNAEIINTIHARTPPMMPPAPAYGCNGQHIAQHPAAATCCPALNATLAGCVDDARSRSGCEALIRPGSGADPLVERVRGQVGAAGPDDGAGLGVDGCPGEACRRARLGEYRPTHPFEHGDLAGHAIGEGDAQHAVIRDDHGSDIGGQSGHRSGSICLSVSPARARRQFTSSSA